MHIVRKKDLNPAELETMRISRSSTTVMTANGEVQTKVEGTVYVKELDLFVTVMLLENTLAVLSLGKLCEDHGCTNHWTSGRKPQLAKKGKRIDCNTSNYVPFVVSGLSTNSSTSSSPTSSTSSSQDPVFDITRYAENPANPLHRPPETKNTNKNEEDEKVRANLLHQLPDWLQEFRKHLVDERSPSEPRGNPAPGHRDTSSSSHELPMESRAKV